MISFPRFSSYRMPKFLDVHPMKGFDEETLRKWTMPAPVDQT